MRPDLEQELVRLISAVRIVSADEFEFTGQRFSLPSSRSIRSFRQSLDPLEELLTQTLYDDGYTRRFDGQLQRWAQGQSRTNSCPSLHERTLLSRSERRLTFQTELTNAVVTRRAVEERNHWWLPQFFSVFGDHPPCDARWKNTLRIYLNSSSTRVPALIQWLTSELNGRHIPFFLKCPSEFAGYERRDTVVLFIEANQFGACQEVVDKIPFRLMSALRDDIPLFTSPLRVGIAFAEAPHCGSSFGWHRCRAVSAGIICAAGHRQHDQVINHVANVFQQHNICWEQPHRHLSSKETRLS